MSYEEEVNKVISEATTSGDGKTVFAEGTSEHLAYAANAELRRRDTQSAYTKNQQRTKALEAENAKLANSWEADAVSNLSNLESARLEELKVQDPDAWRTEIANLEDQKRTEFKDKRQVISDEATASTEMDRRVASLDAYNLANPDAQLTDDVIDNDIPPRITNALKDGTLTFDEFITKASGYLAKPKKLAPGAKAPESVDFAGARGTHTPSDEALESQSSDDYTKEVF